MTSRPLPELWREHQHAAFPASCLCRSFKDQPLVKLDGLTGALLTACLGRDGQMRHLPPEKLEQLQGLGKVLEELDAEAGLEGEAREYFRRLLVLARAVIKP